MHHRSIDTTLHSQLDIDKLPEYYPNPKDHYNDYGITSFAPDPSDSKKPACSVFVPALPGSAFWISYLVSPPVPDEQYFLFKLYIDGAHITNWSTGKTEGWRGKTMFALFESPEDADGRQRIEKRMLCFAPPEEKGKDWGEVVDMFDETACVEIRVHRADARKRIQRHVETYGDTQHVNKGKGINLVNAGRAGPEHPKRFYKFALIDPVDQPFATFRYYYRTRDQLRDLGVLRPDNSGSGEENDLSVIEPHDGSPRSTSADQDSCSSANSGLQNKFRNYAGENTMPKTSNTASRREQSTATSCPTRCISLKTRGPEESEWQPHAYVPHGVPESRAETLDEQSNERASQRDSFMPVPPRSYRLSIPPSIKLEPTKPAFRPLPRFPQQNGSSPSIGYRPHPAYPADCTVRTPSPVKSFREEISTSSSEKRAGRGRTASLLMSTITSVWKYRGLQARDAVAPIDSSEDAPSVQ